jgi:hypothetical protein
MMDTPGKPGVSVVLTDFSLIESAFVEIGDRCTRNRHSRLGGSFSLVLSCDLPLVHPLGEKRRADTGPSVGMAE